MNYDELPNSIIIWCVDMLPDEKYIDSWNTIRDVLKLSQNLRVIELPKIEEYEEVVQEIEKRGWVKKKFEISNQLTELNAFTYWQRNHNS